MTRKKYAATSYKQITLMVPELAEFGTEKDYLGARILVKSRVFGVTIDGEETRALVPVADMLNHEDKCQIRWDYDNKQKGFCMKSEEDIKRGE
jgi:protein-histidine N-methyltransferase